jgi:hypothetical protein
VGGVCASVVASARSTLAARLLKCPAGKAGSAREPQFPIRVPVFSRIAKPHVRPVVFADRDPNGDLYLMTRALPYTQAFAERAIKAVRKQGMRVTGITVRPDGAITVHADEERASSALTAAPRLRDAREKFGAGR